MNCKPGDLAIVVGGNPLVPPALGAIVRVTVLNNIFSDSWETDPPIFDPSDSYFIVIQDAHLRPIRPQDDDAQDESYAWLPPVPTKEHA